MVKDITIGISKSLVFDVAFGHIQVGNKYGVSGRVE